MGQRREQFVPPRVRRSDLVATAAETLGPWQGNQGWVHPGAHKQKAKTHVAEGRLSVVGGMRTWRGRVTGCLRGHLRGCPSQVPDALAGIGLHRCQQQH